MDLASFRTRYPEFASAEDAQVQASLDDAATVLPVSGAQPWGAYYDQAHGLLAAHRLSISPWGMQARLDSNSADTTYGATFQKLLRQVTAGQRVF